MPAREDLQGTVERLTTILDSISEIFYTVDHAWRFTYLTFASLVVIAHPFVVAVEGTPSRRS